MMEAYAVIGRELAQMEKARGELFRGTQQEPRENTTTLPDLGITKNAVLRMASDCFGSKSRFGTIAQSFPASCCAQVTAKSRALA